MRIFGRKANRQSQIPLPPELSQYYAPTFGAQVRRTALLVLPVLAVAILAGGLVWGGWWLTHHETKTQGRSTIQVGQNGPTKINGSSNPGKLPTYLPSKPMPSKTQPKPTATPGVAKAQPQPEPSPSSSLALVNTGPNLATVLLPLITTLLASIVFEVHQRRSVQN